MGLHRQKQTACIILILAGMIMLIGISVFRTQYAEAWNEVQGGTGNVREDSVLAIYTAEDYVNFVNSVKAGNRYEGLYVNLYEDLDFAGVTGDLVAGNEENTQYHFEGIFDGNGHHIRNIVIQSDTEAGLFRNLEGTVCNLEVESGVIQGTLCGGIASSVEMGGRILNCASRAEIRGDTLDGLTGRMRGRMQNCMGPYEEKSVSEMNQGLSGFDGSFRVEGWNSWELRDGVLSLSERSANTLVSMTAGFRINMEQITLRGYYSERDGIWCFALPGGCENMDSRVLLQFSDGKEKELYRAAGCRSLTCEAEGVLYEMEFLAAGNAPSLMLDLPGSNGVDYLHSDKENRLQGAFALLDSQGGVLEEGRLDRIKGHGHDSWRAPKKSYNLRFHEAIDLLGIGASEDYVLLAAWQENSLLAYKVTFDLSKEVGMRYAPESRFVHVYMSGDYMGMYLLVGKVEIGEHRFDLRNLFQETQQINRRLLTDYERQVWHSDVSPAQRTWFAVDQTPADVTGDYLLELSTVDYDREESNFVSDRNFSFMFRSMPSASQEQINYIADYWQGFEDALYSEDGYNSGGKYYTEYMDLESFADQWLFYELNAEPSVNDSVYFYKESDRTGDGLLHASWPWDMENSLIREGDASCSWFARMPDKTHGYWVQLYRHKDFAEAVYREWTDKFVPAIEKALQKGPAEEAAGICSLDWYLEKYGADGWMDQSLWAGSDYREKLEQIRRIYTERRDFLTRALACYQSGYQLFYVEDQILYGESESGEKVPIESEGL